MPRVVFIAPDGSRSSVACPVGTPLMRAAVDNDVAGIVGECGGCLSCATCHVYIRPPWDVRLPPAQQDEMAMLEFAAERERDSRLCCRITMTAALDGLEAHLPRQQA